MPVAAATAPSAEVWRNLRRLKLARSFTMTTAPLSGTFRVDLAVAATVVTTFGADDRRPGSGIALARAHQLHFEIVAVGPIQCVQVLDAAAVAIINHAYQLDQRRTDADLERPRGL